MQKWEYCIGWLGDFEQGDREKKLNTLGEEGWELVCPTDGSTNCRFFYFKRQKCSPAKYIDHAIHPSDKCYCNDCYASRFISGKE